MVVAWWKSPDRLIMGESSNSMLCPAGELLLPGRAPSPFAVGAPPLLQWVNYPRMFGSPRQLQVLGMSRRLLQRLHRGREASHLPPLDRGLFPVGCPTEDFSIHRPGFLGMSRIQRCHRAQHEPSQTTCLKTARASLQLAVVSSGLAETQSPLYHFQGIS